MTFDFHPEAEAEFLHAIDLYENCAPGLGEDFALEVQDAVQSALSFPQAWPVLDDGARRRLVHRFPCGVLYSVEPDRIYILAVMHLHRDPECWKRRR